MIRCRLYRLDPITYKDSGKYESYLNTNAKVIHITLNDYLIGSWAADYQKFYPLDMTIAADTSILLAKLYEICKEKLTQNNNSKSSNVHFKKIETIHNSY